VEELFIEVMKTNKIVELFQTMAIMSLNMENLNLEVSSLKNRLAIKKSNIVGRIGEREGLPKEI